ncbi:U7 snRNA-associated Sm-like protein LSm11 isoform X2 [Parasteatoda tepidariorum]|uniref:U7 snRNA-associated Sm-like protein LSm11 isoform X2 n=1 Tax=Parasteatoda tepidariorum TaxID=114398 RepID=UPI001C723F2C|nr:U7 snRNA-associated Sm-like protein LSm11 isoform X2 [Parasteatoda tepidariorum]
MSYRDRRDSHGRRHDSRDRHDSRRSDASSSRRSRSPSPPLLHKDVPRSFGRIPDEAAKDDDSNVLQRMTKKFVNCPLGSLTKCLEGNRKIKVWTRNFKEVRGICTGYVVAFDKHWNLVMCDVDEVYLKRKKHKTPCFEDLRSAENFSELPQKTPKEKKNPASVETQENQPPTTVEKVAEGAKEKKKKRIKKKKGSAPHKRHVKQLFVRGDSIVMAAILEQEDGPE